MRASSYSGVRSTTSDLRELRAALIANWTSLLTELLGKPSHRAPRQWRWNKRGSFSAAVSGPKTGTWFDFEAGIGGGPLELIAQVRGGDWREAADWARSFLGLPAWSPAEGQDAAAPPKPAPPPAVSTPDPAEEWAAQIRLFAQRAAAITWERAGPVDREHAYLRRKGVQPFGIRLEPMDVLIVPLIDLDGTIHTIQFIYEDGTKRFLRGGAKAGHFALIGGPLEAKPAILICEGWATGATAHEATGLPVAAAMDAGNMKRVAPLLRGRYPDARLVLLADNDNKPGRANNPGVAAATAAARAVDGHLAIPSEPGDFNDLASAQGLDAVRAAISAAQPVPPPAPTYPRAVLPVADARHVLEGEITAFIETVVAHWARVDADAAERATIDPYTAFSSLSAATDLSVDQAA